MTVQESAHRFELNPPVSVSASSDTSRTQHHITWPASLVRCLGWLLLTFTGLAATGYSISSASSGHSSTQQAFSFTLIAIMSGAFTALCAHLSITHLLMALTVRFAGEPGMRRIPAALLRIVSPKQAKMVALSLGIGSTAFSLACAPGLASPHMEQTNTFTHGTQLTQWDVFLSDTNSGSSGSSIRETSGATAHAAPGIAPDALAYSTLPSLAWQDTSLDQASGTLKADPESNRSAQEDSASTPKVHTVVQGECVWEIAAMSSPHPLTNQEILERTLEIQKLNPQIVDINIIHPGQKIVLPG